MNMLIYKLKNNVLIMDILRIQLIMKSLFQKTINGLGNLPQIINNISMYRRHNHTSLFITSFKYYSYRNCGFPSTQIPPKRFVENIGF